MAKERIRAKHEQAASARADFQRRKRQKTLVTRGVGGLLIVLVATAAGFCVVNERELTQSVTTATYPGGQHLAGRITYRETPPLGGVHNGLWQNCGIYDVPIHSEYAVHSMEHGAVWITYRPDLPGDQIQQLKALAADDYMLLSPFPGLSAPVVASAWNNQVSLESASDPRLQRFITRYKNNPSSTPELGAACVGGTSAIASASSLDSPTPGPMRR